MAKTIVIKGASYSDNALDKVSFSGTVPCTGIEFENETISITNYAPVTVEYSVTPEDTTDAVTWASSDTDVVTVADGVITAVGIGTATVTATCGNYSATASVTVSIQFAGGYVFGTIQDSVVTYGSKSISESYSRVSVVGSGNQAADYALVQGTGISENYYPVLLPNNTKSITVKITDKTSFYNDPATNVFWFKNEYGEVAHPNNIKFISMETSYNIKSEMQKSFNVPSGADCVAITIRLSSTHQSSEDPATIMSGAGFTIEYSPNVVT